MKRIFLFLSVALLVVAVSCKKEEEAKLADNDYRLSVLSKVSDLTTNTVTLSGHFEAGKNYKDAEHGIAVTGVINGSVQICKFPSEDSGDFSCEVTGMIPGSDYAFDAYALQPQRPRRICPKSALSRLSAGLFIRRLRIWVQA